jgi:hypothetical protein
MSIHEVGPRWRNRKELVYGDYLLRLTSKDFEVAQVRVYADDEVHVVTRHGRQFGVGEFFGPLPKDPQCVSDLRVHSVEDFELRESYAVFDLYKGWGVYRHGVSTKLPPIRSGTCWAFGPILSSTPCAEGDYLDVLPFDEQCRLFNRSAQKKGWWEHLETVPDVTAISEKLALVHSEVSEALEELRLENFETAQQDGKPVGFMSELADIIIRVGDLAVHVQERYPETGSLGEAVVKKYKYNLTRAHRHGGKAV